jgi:ribose-phosphate pyrophosphokinase
VGETVLTKFAILSGRAQPALAESISAVTGFRLLGVDLRLYPDAEVVELQESVRGAHVFIVQPTSPPPEPHLFELLLLADAARRAGAAGITAVVPYFGYARQDRRAHGARTAVGARVAADVLATRVDRLLTVDLHSPPVEGFFSFEVDHLEAFPLLVERLGNFDDGVVIAPDLGAVRLADRYARALDLPAAVVHKERLSGTEVTAERITGDVKGRVPLIVDDMIVTGGTIASAVDVSVRNGARPGAVVVATHAVFAAGALERLAALPVRHIVTTDSVAVQPVAGLEVVSLAPLLGDAILRISRGLSLGGLVARV